MEIVTPALQVLDQPDHELVETLGNLLRAFNTERSAIPYDGRLLTIKLADPTTGSTIGGLLGSTAYSFLHIDLLYVPESSRGTGLGSQLLIAAEDEARKRKCMAVWLDTFSFQARGFYERHGYQLFGILEGNPPGHSRFFLRKNLTPDIP